MPWLRSLISPDRTSDVRRTVRRLFDRASPTEVYTLPQLAEQLHVSAVENLIAALAELTSEKVVDQVFRVESPKNRGGIEDFDRLEDIPDRIRDWRQDAEIDVDPHMVRVLFRKHARGLPRASSPVE